ncbi:t3pks [Didymella heteroderae]|uniref:T3pks n=1 Tax=Didymella heteroderae TaxID=1769908 RepID=A0A9P4WW23_9PLEO|nr:t3pks [Didymella heteroderae]
MAARNGSVYITGLAHQYPEHSQTQEQFVELVTRLVPEHISSPGFQRLLHVNRNTKIASRPTIFDHSTWTKDDATPPTIDELSQIFRTTGVDLAVAACDKALREARLSASDITHVVAVTCTDQGSPGYDLFVSQKLQLPDGVQRTLLHGVGCAGGLSALREAANLAAAASGRGRPARVLVFATELCSLFLRAELQAACKDDKNLHIAPALFSDASAALVVCNGLAMKDEQKPIFELQEWGSALIPGTKNHMSYSVSPSGMIATITKEVPKATVGAISSMFEHICSPTGPPLDSSLFDWAVHPGGLTILKGAQQAMNLTDDHIRASLDVYTKFGNSSSPTVLVVLDKLRKMGRGRDDVVATSFGPGLMIEMFHMRRCRDLEARKALGQGVLSKAHKLGMAVVSRLSRSGRGPSMVHKFRAGKEATGSL